MRLSSVFMITIHEWQSPDLPLVERLGLQLSVLCLKALSGVLVSAFIDQILNVLARVVTIAAYRGNVSAQNIREKNTRVYHWIDHAKLCTVFKAFFVNRSVGCSNLGRTYVTFMKRWRFSFQCIVILRVFKSLATYFLSDSNLSCKTRIILFTVVQYLLWCDNNLASGLWWK